MLSRLAATVQFGEDNLPGMTTIRCTQSELTRGIHVPLDERTTIVVSPDALLATLAGHVFESRKSFVLPGALNALAEVFAFALKARANNGLIVGHTESSGDLEEDEALSRRRAEIAAAWLRGDPEPWLELYDDTVAEAERWGTREDHLMLAVMPSSPGASATAKPGNDDSAQPKDPVVESFQQLHGLKADGILGPVTRRKLIEEYFKLSRNAEIAGDQPDGGDAEPHQLEVQLAVHAAGANFAESDVEKARKLRTQASEPSQTDEGNAPNPEASAESDGADAASSSAEQGDARIDFFFTVAQQPLVPAPGAADGEEYLEWIRLATFHRRFVAGGGAIPGRGKIALVLMDKFGRVLHKQREYRIDGPESFSGTTNALGMIEHSGVPSGDYQLRLTLRFFQEHEEIVDEYTLPALVLDADEEPERRMIGVVPRCTMASIKGMLFDTNKCFILNSAIDSLKSVRHLYEANNPGKLLVVGHTDSTGDPSYNDPLSLERAEAVLQYLEDDVDAWLKNYDNAAPEKQWGQFEDQQMFSAVMGLDVLPSDPVTAYQEFHNTRVRSGSLDPERLELEADGEIGPKTRRELVTDYMHLDGTTLKDNPDFDIESQAHGCGENFPLDASGQELDLNPEDDKEDQVDRRVELFFFDAEFGILPEPPGKNSRNGSTEYPTWREQAEKTEQQELAGEIHELRVLGLDLQPVGAGVPCQIRVAERTFRTTTSADGIVRLVASVGVTSCDMQWELAPTEGESPVVIDRPGVVLTTVEEQSVGDCLLNLGFDDPSVEERVQHYQMEFGRSITGAEQDVAAEVFAWHDGGPKPIVGSSSGSASTQVNATLVGSDTATPTRTGGRRKTVGVSILARKFIAPGERTHDKRLTPAASYQTNPRGHLSGMQVPEGCHTAITLLGRSGLSLTSLNKQAVTHTDATWLEKDRANGVRDVFFYARMDVPDDRKETQIVDTDDDVARPIFQVNVVPHFQNRPMLVRLFGGSVVLNGQRVTNWQGTKTITDAVREENRKSWAEIVQEINGLAGSFKHLVINAHGLNVGDDDEFKALIACGTFIRRENLDEWDKLRKFEYIWLSSCNVGLDVKFVKEITRRTGAKVIAADLATSDGQIPPQHTTFSTRSLMKIYAPDSTDPLGASPIKRNEFFGGARRRTTGNLESDLDFNLVTDPLGPTEHSPRAPGRNLP